VFGTQLVTGLFAAADTADRGVTGFFSKLLALLEFSGIFRDFLHTKKPQFLNCG
jgi:hypothetical protein